MKNDTAREITPNRRRMRVVAIGGGTGQSMLLRSLKNYPISLSAIVTMTDNGASSGRLSREMGTLPPGDVRKCLAALASDEMLLTKLFEYRFKRGRGIAGHSLGNLLLLALSEITGDFESAVEASSKILSVKGQVIPSTLDHVSLVAELGNGQMALGEVDIPVMGHRFGIKRITVIPPDAKANPTAIRFITNADLIVVGPGSLFTSIVPNFLIKELREAFENSPAAKIYICNVSTEHGETENFTVDDHVRVLREVVNGAKIDGMIVNNKIIERSKHEGRLGSIRNITTKKTEILGIPVFLEDVIDQSAPLFHDPKKLARSIWKVINSRMNATITS